MFKEKLDSVVGKFNFLPGMKTNLAAVAAFALAVIAAWNTLDAELALGAHLEIPQLLNAVVLALLGAGAANSKRNLAS